MGVSSQFFEISTGPQPRKTMLLMRAFSLKAPCEFPLRLAVVFLSVTVPRVEVFVPKTAFRAFVWGTPVVDFQCAFCPKASNNGTDNQTLLRHVHRLSAVHESLLPALTRLHSILNGRQRPARTTACAGADRRFGEAVPRRALPIEGRFLRCIPCEVAAQRDPSGATGSFFTPCGILSPRGWCRRASRFIRCNGAWGTRPLP